MTAAATATTTGQGLNAADAASLRAMLTADPVWADLEPAAAALGLPDKVVLHAGPPVGSAVSAPIRNSAAMAILFEGWADSEADAYRMIDQGAVHLLPAQDHAVVVPLAAVLTRSMLVHVIADGADDRNRSFSPLNGGSGPAMRLGKAGPEVVQHLRWLNGEFGALLRRLQTKPIALVPIANAALEHGDDLHGRTAAATAGLSRVLFGDAEPIPFIKNGPSFFLNLWMAACKCMALAGNGIAGSGAVTAIGGNGNAFGLKVAGLPDRWFSVPAQPPFGALEAGYRDEDRLGAIGDSAIVDAQGFGAMAMHDAPAQQQALGRFMPAPSRELGASLLSAPDRRFADAFAIRTGLFARRVAEASLTPAIALGMLDRTGRHGRIGGGIYATPREPFVAARNALQNENR